jgi:hypothetical protein
VTGEVNIESIRSAAAAGKIQWRQHALERLLEREITGDEVRSALVHGDVVEIYPGSHPYPSCLVMHLGEQVLHVVVAVEPASGVCHVITAYRPSLDRFEADFKTRRKKS